MPLDVLSKRNSILIKSRIKSVTIEVNLIISSTNMFLMFNVWLKSDNVACYGRSEAKSYVYKIIKTRSILITTPFKGVQQEKEQVQNPLVLDQTSYYKKIYIGDTTYIRNKKEFGSKNIQFEILVLFLMVSLWASFLIFLSLSFLCF